MHIIGFGREWKYSAPNYSALRISLADPVVKKQMGIWVNEMLWIIIFSWQVGWMCWIWLCITIEWVTKSSLTSQRAHRENILYLIWALLYVGVCVFPSTVLAYTWFIFWIMYLKDILQIMNLLLMFWFECVFFCLFFCMCMCTVLMHLMKDRPGKYLRNRRNCRDCRNEPVTFFVCILAGSPWFAQFMIIGTFELYIQPL